MNDFEDTDHKIYAAAFEAISKVSYEELRNLHQDALQRDDMSAAVFFWVESVRRGQRLSRYVPSDKIQRLQTHDKEQVLLRVVYALAGQDKGSVRPFPLQ